MTLMVTGGAGFIGLNFVKHIRHKLDTDILVIDKFGYASNRDELDAMGTNYEEVDIADKGLLSKVFDKYKITDIVHFAAESHVDNSIKNVDPFIQSNIIGTVNLLELSVKHNIERFVHISTDEVFGEITHPDKFNELSNINPRNPYSASKAAAEHFVIAYGNTHKLPYIIINSSNNYGPWQYPEKLIPLTISKLLKNQKVPIYGKGDQIRDWIYVEDTCSAILKILVTGKLGDRYCIGGDSEITNIELVQTIIKKMNVSESLIEYVTDRPGHDVRYATDISKIRKLGWQPVISLSSGLDKTIEWITKYENRI